MKLAWASTEVKMREEDSSTAPEHSIPDVGALLRLKLGESLVVDSCRATEFLPPGENYGSLILKVEAVIRRRGEGSEDEELSMIAKVPPPTQQQREMFDSPFTFKKECFMYETILPTYKNFERECGVKEEELFDVGPLLYGSRLNLEFGEEFDDNAVILMENLKTRGFYSGNRYVGLDLDHTEVALKAIARFHALGIAMKQKKPDFFEILKVRSKCLKMRDPEEWVDATNDLYSSFEADPVLKENYDTCVNAVKAGSVEGDWCAVPEEPWSTIIHADFWINNILFHRNEDSGQIDDVKFVDFQNYLFMSPLRELAFVLGAVVDHRVSTDHIERLIDLYYETFVSKLEFMGCDASPYSRDQFDQRIAKDAYAEFSHSVFMLKITTTSVNADDPESKNIQKAISGIGNEHYYSRMRDLVNGYKKRGWFYK